MSRLPVTIVVLAWNDWKTTKACLDSLRPTLGVRDQVLVVDNGSRDETAAGLTLYPWVEVVTNGENQGFAGGCNAATPSARHDIVVFLHNDTLLASRWIEPLVSAFEDPSVAAAGPVSNNAPGAQWAPEATYEGAAAMRRFARGWSGGHRAQYVDSRRLNSFCLAVRRSLLQAVGGFDDTYAAGGYDDDDLCVRLTATGGRLMICKGSFVHHGGHQAYEVNGVDWFEAKEANRKRFISVHGLEAAADHPSPLVSACLITKDESERLPSCLDSLEGLADEIVVYDTGSSDDTVEIARARGARVIEGYWDDDFSRARNAALEHCRGEWVAWLDADETLQTDDAEALRAHLAGTPAEFDAWSVRIENLMGAGVGSQFIHHASRFFRRNRCEWTGRLHEQIARRGDHGAVRLVVLGDIAYLRHTGYLNEAVLTRNKAERNLRVAQAEVEGADGWDKCYSLTSLARSLMLAGRREEALERIEEALDAGGNGITRRLAIRSAIDALVALGRTDDALAWCEKLRAEGGDRRSVYWAEIGVRLAREEFDRVLTLADRLGVGVTDEDGMGTTAGALAGQRAKALAGLERFGEAADVLLECLKEAGVLDTHLGELVDYLLKANRPLDALVAAIPADKTTMFLAQVLQLQGEPADLVLDACLSGPVDRKAVLATASKLALRLPLERSMVWSARLRDEGFGFACPLVAVAAMEDAPTVMRARAAAIATKAFGDERAPELWRRAFDGAAEEDKSIIVTETMQICPELLSGTSASVAVAS